eukprot:Clim_evm58s147 gene=Clim_evmTU58s147
MEYIGIKRRKTSDNEGVEYLVLNTDTGSNGTSSGRKRKADLSPAQTVGKAVTNRRYVYRRYVHKESESKPRAEQQKGLGHHTVLSPLDRAKQNPAKRNGDYQENESPRRKKLRLLVQDNDGQTLQLDEEHTIRWVDDAAKISGEDAIDVYERIPENELSALPTDLSGSNVLQYVVDEDLVLDSDTETDDLAGASDDEDSNAENHWANDYPDEEEGDLPKVRYAKGPRAAMNRLMNDYYRDDEDDDLENSLSDDSNGCGRPRRRKHQNFVPVHHRDILQSYVVSSDDGENLEDHTEARGRADRRAYRERIKQQEITNIENAMSRFTLGKAGGDGSNEINDYGQDYAQSSSENSDYDEDDYFGTAPRRTGFDEYDVPRWE